ncbi:MAG: DUF899 domain-containing protein [Pseudomonadota bacterium]
MTHPVVDRASWLKERMALLRREKAVTRELDLLALERQKLPWVRIDKTYTLDTPSGPQTLLELFGPHRQLIVYHFMFGPDWSEPCDGCSAWAAAFDGTIDTIEQHDATLIAVSHAPLEKLEAVRRSRGWSFLWASSAHSDFNRDFNMTTEPTRTSKPIGDETVFYERGESGGINVFVRSGETLFHSYSAHNRGIQQMNGAFGYVDLLPFGGN